jgi:hypothetical protein
MGNVSFIFLLNLGHAAIAIPTLRLWAEWCSRRQRAR